MQQKMPGPWKGTKWEYERLVLDGSFDEGDDVVGALTEGHLRHAISFGGDGWELVSAQAGGEPIPSAPGETKPVMVLVFKRPIAP